MKIVEGITNQIVGNVFSGFYKQSIRGLKGRYYEFSSPSTPKYLFDVPPDAKLTDSTFTGNKLLAVGHRLRGTCQPISDRTGSLYFYDNIDLIGTCHGYGRGEGTYYSGYNFYNAFYPMGYFIPPFGENISIFKSNQDGYSNLSNGSCNNLSATEYNEMFGIVSKSASDTSILTTTLAPNIYAPIYSPREVCPPEVASSSYYDEFQFTNIPGTSKDLGANNQYNGNPIPTSLDSFDIKVNGRYETEVVAKDTYIVYEGGRPVSSYSVDSQKNKLNNNLCHATLMETKVSSNRGSNGTQLIGAPDANAGSVGDQVSFAGAEHFHYWHFTFKENAETLPFYNNFVATEGSKTHPRKLNEGTQLFLPVISSDEYYWQNRQCPDTVDFLPYTFGASIYACPSEHFDVPYYAALKKFGFYGTRFLNSCKALNLENTLSGVSNASEMPQSESNYLLDANTLEPEDLDKDGYWSFPGYDNLLKVAKAEERYANMYALNKAFFFWANSGYIVQDVNYQSLISENPAVYSLFNSLILKFQNVYTNGIVSFTGNEPNVLLRTASNTFTIIESGKVSDLLLNNNEYIKFRRSLENTVSGSQLESWNLVEQKYGYYVSNGTSLNEEFYQTIISGREKRIRTRYLENLVRGNAIDLFPLNNITFSTDSAKDYIENTGWGRSNESFGVSSDLPQINRRYFEGAYGKPSSITGLIESLNALSIAEDTSYYPGFFNDVKINKTLPVGTYQRAVSGKILDAQKRSFSPSGWLALGYNEIGKLEGNFSCFTPLFIQQPIPTVFCKIGQKPTLRALAVDYHTLPEDKISRRYPEIIYWGLKLKLLDCNGRNMYPLKYKWYRIPKDNYSNSLGNGSIFTDSEPASLSGSWGCLEGDNSPNCTVFHPLDSYPIPMQQTDESDYTFIKGAVKNVDDDYYYYCTVSGRFGVRISEPSELHIEDWLRFDMSVKNGLNAIGNVGISFEVTDYNGIVKTIEIENTNSLSNYGGYEQDINAVPESVIEQKIPPPNAGYGDVQGFRFIGPHAYVGATRTYTPSRLTDTRGLRETWGHFLEYGQLVPFEKNLTQTEGDLLYGYQHLPECDGYQMANGKKGVKVIPTYNGYKIGHWSLGQRAVVSNDMKAGVKWDKLINFGELYPPSNSRIDNAFPNFGIGHWQWGNNLGAIKRFGKFSTKKDVMFVGGYLSTPEYTNNLIDSVKEKLISPTDLAGENCGYTNYGLGRNMLYYLEAFERFYIICDPLKKKNVPNKTFLCPGMRLNNSAIQYFWLGKPSNTYVKRRPMYGPYAYQWRVSKHNRDRNGNGISEGFYSMGYSSKYSLMYDAPSIYGLYIKTKTNSRYKTLVQELKDKRNALKSKLDLDSTTIRNVWFGEKGNEGTSRNYGDITFSCIPTSRNYDKEICEYVGQAQSLATNLNFSDHKCPEDLLAVGACFDPCLSMRHAQGFYPGGKLLDLFGYGGDTSKNDVNDKNVRIVPLATVKDNEIQVSDEPSVKDSNLKFRSPINTPHSRITRGVKKIDDLRKEPTFVGGISTCQDGGSDHCNYITPTIHLGPSNYLLGQSSIFSWMKNYNAEVYHADYNIRGEIT